MSYSCNDNQNYFWGADQGRTTSRVLAPPGGKTSICLGSYEEPAPTKTKKGVEETKKEEVEEQQPAAVDATKGKENDGAALAKTSKEEEEDAAAASKAKATADAMARANAKLGIGSGFAGSSAVSANAYASGSNQNSGNVMTGRPTSRVLAPPGGHCSIQLF
eukprot:CAMPEP_0181026126 /NCGR_PEP_ID=MMETSP1070-20121207/3469_1 /TAXON_ID=265543 /ORGANISM="Minutocellus polymorphus, Strain NH13" /LENGTH=161 /DNA_ID=CAMNT_0023103289 /DNA_START=16 /DNA_END=501 /DNA_ORIENTATION=-